MEPRKEASDTVAPSGAVRLKAGAGPDVTFGAPSSAMAIWGSADRLAAAAAIGATPTRSIPSAPTVAAIRPARRESIPSHQDRCAGGPGAGASAATEDPAATGVASGSTAGSAERAADATGVDATPTPAASAPAGDDGRVSAR